MERPDLAALAGVFAGQPVTAPGRITLDDEAAHHLRVRRLAEGTGVRVHDGLGHVGAGTIARLAKRAVEVELDVVHLLPEPPDVRLLVPVADRERMLWLAEKVVELGVRGWHPVWWRRSRSVSPRGEGEGFRAKVRARMASALVQSGGAWLPDVEVERELAEAAGTATGGRRLLLDRDGAPLLAEVATLEPGPVWVAVGPEGGVEQEERARLLAEGFRPVRLGPGILRFETAGVCAMALLQGARDAAPNGPERS